MTDSRDNKLDRPAAVPDGMENYRAASGTDSEKEAAADNRPVRAQAVRARRADSGNLHAVRHGVLSREIMAALVRLGGNAKTYRRLERQFRAALQPSGPWGELFFDRFWSSYLRLMLIGQLESTLLTREPRRDGGEEKGATLVPGEQPMLVLPSSNGGGEKSQLPFGELPPELLRQLVLAQRYDTHYGREMYRALAILLLLRRGGEQALEGWAAETLGGAASSKGRG